MRTALKAVGLVVIGVGLGFVVALLIPRRPNG